jgi:hypothetical protein
LHRACAGENRRRQAGSARSLDRLAALATAAESVFLVAARRNEACHSLTRPSGMGGLTATENALERHLGKTLPLACYCLGALLPARPAAQRCLRDAARRHAARSAGPAAAPEPAGQRDGQPGIPGGGEETIDCRGFQLLVTPVMSHEGLWEFSYCIFRPGQRSDSKEAVRRRQTVNCHRTAAAAYLACIELAKVEVDSLRALEQTV